MGSKPTVEVTKDRQSGEFPYSRKYVDYSRRVKTTTESFANLFSPDGLLEEEITDLISNLEKIQKDSTFKSIAENGHGKPLDVFVRQIEMLKRQRENNEVAEKRQAISKEDPSRKNLYITFPCKYKHQVLIRNIEPIHGRGNPTLPKFYAVCTQCGQRADFTLVMAELAQSHEGDEVN